MLRGALTLLAIVGGLLVVWAVFVAGFQTSPDQPPDTASKPPAETPQEATPEVTPEATPPPPEVTPEPTPEPEPRLAVGPKGHPQQTTNDAPPPVLHVKPVPRAYVPIIGSTDPKSGYKIEVDLSAWGASIMRIQLTDHSETVKRENPYIVLDAVVNPDDPKGKARVFPFAARNVWIDGQQLSLVNARWDLIYPAKSECRTTYERRPQDKNRTVRDRAEYVLTIQDADDKPVVELRRTFSVEKDSYHLRCRQQIVNKTDRRLEVIWEQLVHGDIPQDKMSYMGDRRQMAVAYFKPSTEAARRYILTDWTARTKLLPDDKPTGIGLATPLWPQEDPQTEGELVWLGSVNRYFALVVHPDITDERTVPGNVPALQDIFPTLRTELRGRKIDDRHDNRVMTFVLSTDQIHLDAGKTADLNLALYAGPRQHDVLATPINKAMQLPDLIKYELGCIWCTFQPLAKALLAFLRGIHFLVRDWAIGIIILVVVVRMILHPITKKSQVQMMTMGKQMQTLQPEIEKLKKKYKDNQQALNKEMMKLYREKGVNPAGMLGCLPMFLQMPIWIALYAMLFLAIELRHEPAFYGFFQIFGGWEFLQDLSSPDAFIRFADHPVRLDFPLLYSLDFSALNILPLVWAVVMYFQQKYMTPPPANEQAAQQQKMMKFMTLLFPIFLYSAPSGLTLYILASSAAGIVDSKLVRKHIKEKEEAGTLLQKKEKKKPKPGGIMDRLGKALEARQRDMARRGSQGPSQGSSRRKKSR